MRREEADGVVAPVVAQAFFLQEAVVDELVDRHKFDGGAPSFLRYSMTDGYARPA